MNRNFCRYLRSKEMYTVTQPEEVLERSESEQSSPCHFWCNQTMTAVGPDDQPVHKSACKPGRSCFEE